MTTRNAEANWHGNLKDGTGDIKLGSGAFNGKYSFGTRFEQAPGTNPEELIGAALAGCYAMALSAELGKNNYHPDHIHATATVHLNKNDAGFAIDLIELAVVATCASIKEDEFLTLCEVVRKNCPIAKALAGSKITVTAKLTA